MTLFKQALANAKLTVLLLLLLNLIWAAIAVYAITGLNNAPKTMTFYVPPAIPGNGFISKSGSVPKATIYSFTYYVWQSIQTWLTNGEDDYKSNLLTYAPYLTDSFRSELENESSALDSQGMLLHHEQTSFEATQDGFNPVNVTYLGHNTWLVHLVMRTVNRIAIAKDDSSFSKTHIVRDATTSYVFKVVRTNRVTAKNRWQLQVAGFAVPPKTMTIYQ